MFDLEYMVRQVIQSFLSTYFIQGSDTNIQDSLKRIDIAKLVRLVSSEKTCPVWSDMMHVFH